jgi:outer membrane receptor for ferrienterochelin and colicins
MKFVLLKLCLIIILTSANKLLAHENAIHGNIQSQEGKPVAGATIRIDGTMLGTIADRDGNYFLGRIPKGEHTVIVTAVGFKKASVEITMPLDPDRDIDFELEVSSVVSGDVVVTATRSDKIYEDVPIKISVVDDKIFESTQSVALRDGIRFQPGLRVEANCQNCGFSQVRLNGLEGRYSQILIDSRPVFSSLQSLYGLDHIPAEMIDRVEVVRGGGSALFGGNAIAGVVNIITKRPHDDNFNADYSHFFMDGRVSEQNFGLNSSSVSTNQDAGVFLFGNYRERGHMDMNGDGFSEVSYIRCHSIGANAFYEPTPYSRLNFTFNTISEFRRGGDSIERPPHEVLMAEDITHSVYGGGLTYEQYLGSKDNKLSLYGSVNFTDKDNYTGVGRDPDGYGYTNSDIFVTGGQFSRNFDNFIYGSSVVTAGFEYQREEVENVASGYGIELNQSVDLAGFYLQSDWSVTTKLSFLAGIRLDKRNFIDNTIINPRATMMYRPMESLTFRGTFTTGYRAPQAYDDDLHAELRGGTRHLVVLDENLSEERSMGYSLSGDYILEIGVAPLSLSVEYFDNVLTDVFVNEDGGFDEFGNKVFIKQNGSGARVNGITGEAAFRLLSGINANASVTYQESLYDEQVTWSEGDSDAGIEAQSSDKIMKTPNLYGYFTLIYDGLENFQFDISGVFTGKMYLPHFAGGIRPDGSIAERDLLVETDTFWEINLKASYEISFEPDLKINIGLLNALNQFQEDFDRGPNRDTDYIYGPLRPRTYFVGISAGI